MMQPKLRAVTRLEIRERLACLIAEIAKIAPEQVTDAATVDDDLHMESVAFVELLVTLEDEYQTEIDPIQVVELNNFGAITDYVYQQAAAGRK